MFEEHDVVEHIFRLSWYILAVLEAIAITLVIVAINLMVMEA